ncbi:hypothetical protein AYI69_g4436 [Smittium culicis]|uniref:Uncharacterized protein n=1 Tax=Smittium culicis TaxID=133412 RepID=A0A1R1YDJ2_9FUNG|nr:hypothetical protein AYI69_g4436 [Smittium culicis]
MCPYAFSQCPEGPASGPDTFQEGQTGCNFPQFFFPPSTADATGHIGGHPDLIGSLMKSKINVFEVINLWNARSLAVLVRMNTEDMPSSSLMRSMAADFPTLATIRIALSISDCMGLHLASLMPNVSPP